MRIKRGVQIRKLAILLCVDELLIDLCTCLRCYGLSIRRNPLAGGLDCRLACLPCLCQRCGLRCEGGASGQQKSCKCEGDHWSLHGVLLERGLASYRTCDEPSLLSGSCRLMTQPYPEGGVFMKFYLGPD